MGFCCLFFIGPFLKSKWEENTSALEGYRCDPVDEEAAKMKWDILKQGILAAKMIKLNKRNVQNHLGLTEEYEYFAACSFYLYYR